jgi:transcriptional regulator with XRE-family HTH domain
MSQIKNKKLLKSIAVQLKELRLLHNVTQEDFYNDTNIHIARIETGNNNLSISTLDAICKYFDISLSKFFSKIEKDKEKPL